MKNYTLYQKAQEEAIQILNENKLFQYCANGKIAPLLYIIVALNFLSLLFVEYIPDNIFLIWIISLISFLLLFGVFCSIIKRMIIYRTRKKLENKYGIKFKDYRKYQQS
ncbi:MAG: hypothetical protein EGQ00_15770 [Parabacteroides johnsonii]|nr:hypothetical protein [Parabacteroides johnsonii]